MGLEREKCDGSSLGWRLSSRGYDVRWRVGKRWWYDGPALFRGGGEVKLKKNVFDGGKWERMMMGHPTK